VNVDLIRKESAPRYLPEGILITVSPSVGKNIFLRTNLDNWKNNYFFRKSLYDVLYLIIPYDINKEKLLYRLNVNGYWIKDPNNKNTLEDKYGTELSVIDIPQNVIYYQSTPVISNSDLSIKKVSFHYYNPDAKEVNFVCSSDKWSQYSHQMEKNDDGYWNYSIDLKNGTYQYYFLVNGKKVVDIENHLKLWDEDVGEVSYFIIK
jgi:hypothetical protein